MKYWIGVVNRDHVLKGLEGGFCQVCHGKKGPLSRMSPNDWLIYYSPAHTKVSTSIQSKNKDNKCQRFVALGQIKDEKVYQFEQSTGFVPFRRCVEYMSNVKEVDINDLKTELEFIQNNRNWGMILRRGLFEISSHDFQLIYAKMTS